MTHNASTPPEPPGPDPPVNPDRRRVEARPRTRREIHPGDVLDGRFRITGIIYRGAISSVFKAEDLQNSGAPAALKVPEKVFEINAALFSRFQREEEIGRKLHHPSIIKFIEVEGKKDRPYIAMDYVPGATLAEYLATNAPLCEGEALGIAALVCEALEHLHQRGVIHRDLKPANIMLCPDKTIRLMDFGIALADVSRGQSMVGFEAGTAQYMAPERVSGKPGDPRTDVYGLGAILYEMLTGVIPFHDADPEVILEYRVTGDPAAPRALNASISAQAEEIVLKALARDPYNRYPTAAAMRRELRSPDQTPVTGLRANLKPSTGWKRGLRKARYAAAWILTPLLAQALLFLWLWHHYAKK